MIGKPSIMMGAGALLDPGELQRAASGWELKNLETPGWKMMVGEHVILRGDVPVETLKSVGVLAEIYREVLQEAIGGDDSNILFSIRIFVEPREFRRFAARSGAPNAESFYDPRSAEIVLEVDGTRGAEWLERSVAHEFTHAYMDRVFKVTAPLWFAEGMAEYFTNLEMGPDGRLYPGALNDRGLLILGIAQLPDIKTFLAIGRDEFYGVNFAKYYAQGWLFVRFLFDFHPKLVMKLLDRKDPVIVFKRVSLEKMWKPYLDAALNQPAA